MKQKLLKVFKSAIYWFIIVGFIALVFRNIDGIAEIGEVLYAGDPIWLILALFMQFIFQFIHAYVIGLSLAAVGISYSYWDLFLRYLAMVFINISTPFGGSGGSFYLVRHFARKEGARFYRIFPALLMVGVIFGLATFLIIIVALVIIYVWYRNYFFVLFSSFALYVIPLMGMAVAMIVASRTPLKFKQLIFFLKRKLGRLGAVYPLSIFSRDDQKLEESAHLFSLGAKVYWEHRNVEIVSFLYVLVGLFFQFMVAVLINVAFGLQMEGSVMLVMVALFYLYTIVSPTPQGLGFAEGVVQIFIVSLGVHGNSAVIMVLAYRGITMWLPIFLGFIAFRVGRFIDYKSSSIKRTLETSPTF